MRTQNKVFSKNKSLELIKLFGLVVVLISCFIFTGISYAQTEVGGPIGLDMTWTLDKSPYIVVQNIEVAEGVTLTIEPGVSVKFEGSALIIKGALIARGTKDRMITFTSNQDSPKPGDWEGISFEDSSVDAVFDDNQNYVSGSILEYCKVEFAKTAVRANYASPFVNRCSIRNNANRGIDISGDNNVIRNGTTEEIVIRNSTIANNKGGIFVDWSDSVTISDNTVTGNEADYGGGICVDWGDTVTISNNTVTRNKAILGGGIYATSNNSVTINNNIVAENAATFQGGGVFAYAGNVLAISNNAVTKNTSGYNFGGVLAWGGDAVTIHNNTITANTAGPLSSNTAQSFCGGVCVIGDSVTISSNTVGDNKAQLGGGICTDGNTVTVGNNTVTRNEAQLGGGIVTIAASVTLPFQNNSVTEKMDTEGATYTNSTITISNNSVTENKAEVGGGSGIAILKAEGTTIIAKNLISNNTGGGIFAPNSLSMSYNTIAQNTGAGIDVLNEDVAINYCNFYGNEYAVRNGTGHEIDCKNNWWDTTDPLEINKKIYDFFDDESLGKVLYNPFLMAPDPEAPSLPNENHPPDLPIDLTQLTADGIPIGVGARIIQSAVQFKARLNDLEGDKIKLQIELQQLDGTEDGFTGKSTHQSKLVVSDGEAQVTVEDLKEGSYRWQARAVDEHGAASDWVSFGNNPDSEPDFIVGKSENQPPVANANGPYEGSEGTAITFDGSGSNDPDGTIVSYEWDLDGDGQYDDATGKTTSKTWDDDYSGYIGLKVTDDGGLTDTTTTTVTVSNVAPTAHPIADVTEIEKGGSVKFIGYFFDPGSDDQNPTFLWNFGDGTSSTTDQNPTHQFAQGGNYTVTLTVTDSDGAKGSDTLTITVLVPPTANHQPDRPTNVSPQDGETGVSLAPTLRASAFSDPDSDFLISSQWQIRTSDGNYSNPFFDSGVNNQIYFTYFTLLSKILQAATTYYWHVRYKDYSEWSEWSEETSFTTEVSPETKPPSIVEDFQILPGEEGKAILTWTNPSDSDLTIIWIVRKEGSYPTDYTDGLPIYEDFLSNPGENMELIDSNRLIEPTYYYAVFSRDRVGNWNNRVEEGRNAGTLLSDKALILKKEIINIVNSTSTNLDSLLQTAKITALNVGYFNQDLNEKEIEAWSDVVATEISFLMTEAMDIVAQDPFYFFVEDFMKKVKIGGTVIEATLGKDVIKEMVEILERGAKDDKKSFFYNAFIPDLEKMIEGEKGFKSDLESSKRAALERLPFLTPEEIELYLEDLKGRELGNEFISQIFGTEAGVVNNLANLKRDDENSWTYKIAKPLYDVSFGLLATAAGFATGGALLPIAITGGKGFIDLAGNYSSLNRDAQMVAFGTNALIDGSWYAQAMKKNIVQGLKNITEGNTPSIPQGKIVSWENIEEKVKLMTMPVFPPMFIPIPAGEEPLKAYSKFGVRNTGEVKAFYRLVGYYRIPFTTVKLAGIGRKYNLQFLTGNGMQIDSKDTSTVKVIYKTIEGKFFPEKGQSISFLLFAMAGKGIYGLSSKNIEWTDVETKEITKMIGAKKSSPGELRVYDSQNRVTGLVNGEVKEEIPDSVYDEENETVVVFDASDDYRYEVADTEKGTYGLDVFSVENGEAITFTASDIPTSPDAVHQYTIDWDALSQGKEGTTVKIDSDGDGSFEQTITVGATLTPLVADAGGPYQGEQTSQIVFDGSASFDLDGKITLYEWDLDGDGIYEVSSDSPETTFVWKTVYEGNIYLRVTDDEGLISVDTARVVVNPKIPKQTALLQNFQNPFNVETWIPFQLAEPTKVAISIYDLSGRLVKKNNLGKLSPGLYITQDRAAYWDGRNSEGEKVSSGVYFYTLQAGDYNATKRMFILK